MTGRGFGSNQFLYHVITEVWRSIHYLLEKRISSWEWKQIQLFSDIVAVPLRQVYFPKYVLFRIPALLYHPKWVSPKRNGLLTCCEEEHITNSHLFPTVTWPNTSIAVRHEGFLDIHLSRYLWVHIPREFGDRNDQIKVLIILASLLPKIEDIRVVQCPLLSAISLTMQNSGYSIFYLFCII